MNEFTVKIDDVSMNFFTDMNYSIEWIVDGHRNDDDYMIITNPTKKITVKLTAARLLKGQFELLMSIVGQQDCTHKAELYDDYSKKFESYNMYNSAVSYKKQNVGGQTVYTDVSFSLIER